MSYKLKQQAVLIRTKVLWKMDAQVFVMHVRLRDKRQ